MGYDELKPNEKRIMNGDKDSPSRKGASDMIKTIIFDFDGTIINTNEIIENGLNLFSRAYRGKRLESYELEALVGKPLLDQMAALCPELALEMTARFRVWYRKRHNALTSIFDGMDELLETLDQYGHQLAIVSNNSSEGVNMGLEHLDIGHLFKVVVTCDDVKEKKPAPEGVQLALQRLGAQAESTLYVGDSAGDLLASRAAGVSNVLVGWTAVQREQLLIHKPDYVVETPMEILEVVSLAETQIA